MQSSAGDTAPRSRRWSARRGWTCLTRPSRGSGRATCRYPTTTSSSWPPSPRATTSWHPSAPSCSWHPPHPTLAPGARGSNRIPLPSTEGGGEGEGALLVFDRGLDLGREVRWDRRHAVRRLRVLGALRHHLRRVLAFHDEAAAGRQVTALEDLGHTAPPVSCGGAIGGTRRGPRARIIPPR